MRALTLGGIVALVAAVVTHIALLYGSPYWETDKHIKIWQETRGMTWNKLDFIPAPTAGSTAIPLANPDTFSTRAIFDVSNGPFVMEGPLPTLCTYWSASFFAHNTDAVLIMSDRDFPDGKVSIAIARSKADVSERTTGVAELGSDKGVMLMRCFMSDRTNPEYLKSLDAERRKMVLRPAKTGAIS